MRRTIRMTSWTLLVALLGSIVATKTVFAVDLCNFGEDTPRTRPNREAGPTEVRVGLFVFDLVNINTVKQEFTLDFFLQAEWDDPRLGEALRKSGKRRCEVPMDDIWIPGTFPLNSRSLHLELPKVAYVHADGSIRAANRILGTFSTRLDLTDFPMDTQTLSMTLISTRYGPDELKFLPESSGREKEFTVAGWSARRPPTRR